MGKGFLKNKKKGGRKKQLLGMQGYIRVRPETSFNLKKMETNYIKTAYRIIGYFLAFVLFTVAIAMILDFNNVVKLLN